MDTAETDSSNRSIGTLDGTHVRLHLYVWYVDNGNRSIRMKTCSRRIPLNHIYLTRKRTALIFYVEVEPGCDTDLPVFNIKALCNGLDKRSLAKRLLVRRYGRLSEPVSQQRTQEHADSPRSATHLHSAYLTLKTCVTRTYIPYKVNSSSSTQRLKPKHAFKHSTTVLKDRVRQPCMGNNVPSSVALPRVVPPSTLIDRQPAGRLLHPR